MSERADAGSSRSPRASREPTTGLRVGSGTAGTVELMTDRPDDDQPNPFAGTPFEQIFRQLSQQMGQAGQGGQPGLGGPGGLDFSAVITALRDAS